MTDQEPNKESILSQDNNIHQNLLDVRDKTNLFDDLDTVKVWAYGVGHFINDLVAACWFNYLFFFLKKVVKTDAAPAALLAGQICDGIATPVVGILSDKTTTRFGQRTPWYVGGLILVMACYLPIYQTFRSNNKTHEYLYYTIFPGLFNVGWASLQISHMSLVPSLTCSRKRRDKLNNLRNSFTFLSNFIVLGLGLVIFLTMNDPPKQYALISYIVASLGLCASIFFLFHIRQVPLTTACHQKSERLKEQLEQEKRNQIGKNSAIQFSEDSDAEGVTLSSNRLKTKVQSIFDWFKMPKFYLFGVCYMGVRLYTNIYGTLLPFYLVDVLKLGKATHTDSVPYTVALVPLITYFSSVLVSSRLNWFYEKFGRKKALLVGTIICVVTIGSFIFLTENTGWVVYILAIFIGCSQTLVLSTGINFISDVIGTKAKTGAFVFGIYSLLDKFSAGAVIFWIGSTQAYSKDTTITPLTPQNITFIKYTMILIPTLAAILATAIVISYPIQQYSKPKKSKRKQDIIRKNSIQEELVV